MLRSDGTSTFTMQAAHPRFWGTKTTKPPLISLPLGSCSGKAHVRVGPWRPAPTDVSCSKAGMVWSLPALGKGPGCCSASAAEAKHSRTNRGFAACSDVSPIPDSYLNPNNLESSTGNHPDREKRRPRGKKTSDPEHNGGDCLTDTSGWVSRISDGPGRTRTAPGKSPTNLQDSNWPCTTVSHARLQII